MINTLHRLNQKRFQAEASFYGKISYLKNLILHVNSFKIPNKLGSSSVIELNKT